jgi:hypothetical protein
MLEYWARSEALALYWVWDNGVMGMMAKLIWTNKN